jgi:CelD/BcsL family acetyltransferase involved in cellulose biosynthesis
MLWAGKILRLVMLNEVPEDAALGRQWNELVLQMERPEVFYTYEWALAVVRAYHESVNPLLILAYEGDSLVGVAALAADEARQQAVFLAGATADYCDIVCPDARRREVVSGVVAELQSRGVPGLVLANLPADSATAGIVTGLGGHKVFSRPAYQCSQIQLRSPEQRQSVRHAVRQKRVRRCLEMLKDSVIVDHLRSWDEIAPVLPGFYDCHIERFRAGGRTSNLASPQRRDFLSELAKLLSPLGWMTLSQLRLAERPIAWHYGFQFARHWFYYLPTFDSSFGEYSPGFNLLLRIIEDACESEETDFVDLGLGDESYKKRLATTVRETLYVTSTSSAADCLRVAARYHAAAAIKSSPRLEQVVRRLLRRPSAASVRA